MRSFASSNLSLRFWFVLPCQWLFKVFASALRLERKDSRCFFLPVSRYTCSPLSVRRVKECKKHTTAGLVCQMVCRVAKPQWSAKERPEGRRVGGSGGLWHRTKTEGSALPLCCVWVRHMFEILSSALLFILVCVLLYIYRLLYIVWPWSWMYIHKYIHTYVCISTYAYVFHVWGGRPAMGYCNSGRAEEANSRVWSYRVLQKFHKFCTIVFFFKYFV